MTALDVAYQAYLTRNPLKRGNATQHAYPAAWRAAIEWVGPSWFTITDTQQLEHIETCDVCIFCEVGRAWGICTRCGEAKEAMPPLGESSCCGSPVSLRSEA